MNKILQEVGFKKLLKFAVFSPLLILFDLLPYPPLRALFLQVFGAKIGKNTVIGRIKFVNVYRTGFKGLRFGDHCFISDYVIFDLANPITFEDHSGIGWGSTLVTHMNVGFKGHPLQKYFPPTNGAILVKRGAFIGVHVTILNGVTIGECALISAGSVISQDVPSGAIMGPPPTAQLHSMKIPWKQ